MNALSNVLLCSLWHATWEGAVALAFIWLICRVSARRLTANAHCWLWRAGYAKLLVGLLWSGAVLLPLLAPTHPVISTPIPLTAALSNDIPNPEPPAEITSTQQNTAPAVTVTPTTRFHLPWQQILAIAYAGGVAACLFRLGLAGLRTRRLLRCAAPLLAGPVTDCATEIAQRIGLHGVPTLAVSSMLDSPALVAGTVVLPAETPTPGAAVLRMVLAHELAHVQRRDLFWEWLGTLTQTLFFFNPLVVLARREERLAREAAADAMAVQATEIPAADYGKMLIAMSLRQDHRHTALIGSLGVIEGGTPLQRRLLALRDGVSRTNARRHRIRLCLILVPLMVMILVPWRVTHGQAQVTTPPNGPVRTIPVGHKTITGVVTDEAGKPVPGIKVDLLRFSFHMMNGRRVAIPDFASTQTDAKGRFTFSKLPAGSFEYIIMSPGRPGRAGQYVSIGGGVILKHSDAEKRIFATLTTGALITGQVVNAQTGQALAGIPVEAGRIPKNSQRTPWQTWAGFSHGLTAADGNYQIRVLPGNDFVGVAYADAGASRNRLVKGIVRKLTVLPGATPSAPELAISLHPAIRCIGPDGKPVADAYFRITTKRTAPPYGIYDLTDAHGTVVLVQPSESGDFSIGHDGRYAFGTIQWSPGRPLLVESDGQTQSAADGIGTVQLLNNSGAVVTGHVESETGRSIPYAIVDAVETDPKNHFDVQDQIYKADALGNFRVSLRPNEDCTLSLNAEGFSQVWILKKPVLLVPGQAVALGTIHLTKADGSISGQLVNAQRKPMEDVLAIVRGRRTGVSAALTNSDGRFRIPNIVPGDVLDLQFCLQGKVSSNGIPEIQSNNTIGFTGVEASPALHKYVWRPTP